MLRLDLELEDDWKVALRSEIITALLGNQAEQSQAFAKIGYYYQCYAPASLYKYYPDTELHLNSVRHNQMWYSAPCNFNDVFDCDIAVDDKKVFSSTLKLLFQDKRGIRPGSPVWKQIKATVTRELKSLCAKFDEFKETTGVSCLSESEDSLLMWAHYANNHRGICVEYDLLEINKILNFTAIPIIYSKERACFNSFDPQTIENDAMKLFIESISSKSPEWNYEKEWRIIRDQAACGSKWDSVHKGALLEMIQPSSIILGCAAQQDFEEEVRAYCKDSRINLYKMKKNATQYKLDKTTIFEFND